MMVGQRKPRAKNDGLLSLVKARTMFSLAGAARAGTGEWLCTCTLTLNKTRSAQQAGFGSKAFFKDISFGPSETSLSGRQPPSVSCCV